MLSIAHAIIFIVATCTAYYFATKTEGQYVAFAVLAGIVAIAAIVESCTQRILSEIRKSKK
jgi:hypothetical protein